MLVDITAGVVLSWILVRFFDILFGKLGFDVALAVNRRWSAGTTFAT